MSATLRPEYYGVFTGVVAMGAMAVEDPARIEAADL
jgi:hypothetical protein